VVQLLQPLVVLVPLLLQGSRLANRHYQRVLLVLPLTVVPCMGTLTLWMFKFITYQQMLQLGCSSSSSLWCSSFPMGS
jgi:hypothetical protein